MMQSLYSQKYVIIFWLRKSLRHLQMLSLISFPNSERQEFIIFLICAIFLKSTKIFSYYLSSETTSIHSGLPSHSPLDMVRLSQGLISFDSLRKIIFKHALSLPEIY